MARLMFALLLLPLLALYPEPAHADPITVVSWLAVNVGTWAASAFVFVWNYAGYIAFAAAYSSYTSHQKRKAARAIRDSMTDRKVMIRSSEAPRATVYGRCRVSGPVAYGCVSGTDSEYLHLVVVLAAHEIDAIESVWFNDEPLGALDGNGWVTSGSYVKTRDESRTEVGLVVNGAAQVTLAAAPSSVRSVSAQVSTIDGSFWVQDTTLPLSVAGNVITLPAGWVGRAVTVSYVVTVFDQSLVQVKGFLGSAAGQRDTDLEAASNGEWTAAHLGKGIARLHVKIKYDQDVFTSGIPNISAVVRGKKLYDPRNSSTAWSENAALATLDYLTSEDGFRAALPEVSLASFIAAANAADETVDSQPRYAAAGVIYTDQPRKDNLAALLSAMVGTVSFTGGLWFAKAGVYSAPVLALDDNDLAPGDISVQARASKRELFNAVRGRFVDPTNGWAVMDFPPYTSATYAGQDGGEVLYRDIDLPFTTDARRAQRIAKLILNRARQALTITATFNLAGYALQPGDTVQLTIARYGWTAKVFRVVEREYEYPHRVKLVLQEEASTVYSWTFDEATTPDAAPNTNLPNPRLVPNIGGLGLTSRLDARSDGTYAIRLVASWAAITDRSITSGGRIELVVLNTLTGAEVTTTVSGDSTEAVVMEAVNDGETYLVNARAVSLIGVRGAWAFSSYYTVAGKTDAPAPPSALTVTNEQFGVRLRWVKSPSFDVVAYEIRVGATFDSAADLGEVQATTFFYQPQVAGSHTFWLRAVDAWGNVSAPVSAAATATIPPVNALAASVDGDSALLAWSPPASSYQIADYEIRVGAVYAAATVLGFSRTTIYRTRIVGLGVVRYWIAPRDVAGNLGTASSVDVIVAAPAQPVIGSEVVDNFVLLRWQDCKTTLPVERYEVYRGAQLVGDNGDGRFAVLFEQVAGLYTYGVKAYDSAGNVSALGIVTVNVSAPPDYVLRDNFDSTFPGTLTNGYVIDGAIHAPMYVETDAAHTTRIGVTTDSAAAGLGYDKWWEPGHTSASYVEDFDLGVTVDPSTITITPTLVEVQGTVTVTYSVKVSATGAFAGEETTYSGQQVYAGTNFRYVRVTITFASSGGDDLVQVTALNVKVATKLRTEAGVVNVTANPTTVNTSGSIDEILAIALTPTGTAARTAVYSYTSGTSFDVYLFDSSGAAVTGQVAWTVRGV